MTTTITPVDVQWRRLNRRMLLVHPIVELGKALPAILGAFLAGHSSGGGSHWGLVVAAVVVVFSLLRWFTTRYRITPDQIQLRHGLLRRKTMAAPTDRVRTVDVSSHLLHRLLGLARVTIGTGTSDRKGRDRLVLDGLSAEAATALRAELLHRGAMDRTVRADPDQSAMDTARPVTIEPVEEELARIEPGWLRYAPFTLTGAITGLALVGVAWRIVNEGRVNLRNIAVYRVLAHRLEHWPLGLDIGAVLVAVMAFVVVASTVGYILSFWRFRLTRHSGGTLHVSRGLLTSRATSIERRRLHGVELSEPLLLRSVGGARCLAIATGLRVGRGAERGGEILLPPAPRDVAVQVATAVLEEASPLTVTLAPHPNGALRRRVMRALGGAVVIGAAFVAVVGLADWPAWLMYLSTVPVLVAAPLALDRYHSLGHALSDGFLVARFGSLVRRRCIVHTDGLIGWNLRTSFFQRRLGLVTLRATTAAGRQSYAILDVSSEDAVRFADAALPGLLNEFRC